MTIHLVTFSDSLMRRSGELCVRSAEPHGVSDSLHWYHEDLCRTNFYAENSELLSRPRGLGYWAWKPWIILKALEGKVTSEQFAQNSFYPPKDGDILVYSDAGVEFIDNVSHIIDRMDQDIFLFGNNWEHAHWCKRDVIEEIWPHRPSIVRVRAGISDYNQRCAWFNFGKQCQASVIFFRVSDYSRKFVAEWLQWCLFEGGRLIDDSPSILPNHPEFREHRHDQAILTTLAYREGIKLHYWPAVYNKGGSPEFVYEKLPEYASDDYPSPLFHHHRRRDAEWGRVA